MKFPVQTVKMLLRKMARTTYTHPCQDSACCKENVFGVRLQRKHRTTCANTDCVDGLTTTERASGETWSVLLLESPPASESTVLELLMQYLKPVPVTLQCESCSGAREGQQQVTIDSLASALVLGFPRAGHVDGQGVQHRHRGHVLCDQHVAFGGKEFKLAAIVEHISGSSDARSGHFVTWIPPNAGGAGWTRLDDLRVEKQHTLPEDVCANVVLACYCSSAILPCSEQAKLQGRRQRCGASSTEPETFSRSVNRGKEGGQVQECPSGTASAARIDSGPPAQAGEADSELPGKKGIPMTTSMDNQQGVAGLSDPSGLLPREQDGHLEFESAVDALLAAYKSPTPSECRRVLQALPLFSCEIREQNWEVLWERLRASVEEYTRQQIVAADAVRLASPVWRTTFFPLAVLFEAWSRTSGLPTVFYVDSFYSLVGSLLSKHVSYDAAGFPVRARFWACGTASPGSGKSPALDPLKEALMEVLREMPDLAPGVAADGFHVQPVGTHAAAVDRLRSTGGYQFIGAGEGGPVLCPAWPSSSTWTQSTHINWQRYLDAATGGAMLELEVKANARSC